MIRGPRKAELFIAAIFKKMGKKHPKDAERFFHVFSAMSDIRFDMIMSELFVNRASDPNIGRFKLPKYSDLERLMLTELIWVNNECGLHNSYWSRMWWMVKGGKLIKSFPPNSILEASERGERKANSPVYMRH